MNWMPERDNTKTEQLAAAIREADAVVVGAGAGLSASAGFTYEGIRFNRYFGDFTDRYGITEMYSGGFYPYRTQEQFWGFWCRYIYINRFHRTPKPAYENVLKLLEGKEYFVITTNVDHCFQKAGIDKDRLFYTQGDYGLWQCKGGRVKKTFDNEAEVKKMLLAQGFWFEHVRSKRGVTVEQDSELIRQFGAGNAWQCGELEYSADWGELVPPVDDFGKTDFRKLSVTIPKALIPYSAEYRLPLVMNLRSDDTFVEDEGWHAADRRYTDFLIKHMNDRVLFLDLGSGGNTPVIFKIPFMSWTRDWPSAIYATINKGQAFTAPEIRDRSIVIDGDIYAVLTETEEAL